MPSRTMQAAGLWGGEGTQTLSSIGSGLQLALLASFCFLFLHSQPLLTHC